MSAPFFHQHVNGARPPVARRYILPAVNYNSGSIHYIFHSSSLAFSSKAKTRIGRSGQTPARCASIRP